MRKQNLVIHIGLSKTATTTIQNQFLSNSPNYGGRFAGHEGELVRELKDLARRIAFIPHEELKARTSKWVDKAQNSKKGPELVLSDEQFLNWRISDTNFRKVALAESPRCLPWQNQERTGSWPFVRFLRDYLAPAWGERGVIQIVLGLRQQSEWLASQYAQMSARIFKPSQFDFEAQVERLIENGDSYLFWDRLVLQLHEAIGPANVHVFLFEELNLPETWRSLAAALKVHGFNDRVLLELQGKKSNQRSSEQARQWKLRKPKSAVLEQCVENSWPENKLPMLRKVSTSSARYFDRWVFRHLARRLIICRSDEAIFLEDGLVAKIQEYCSTSNGQLTVLLGKDLKRFGY